MNNIKTKKNQNRKIMNIKILFLVILFILCFIILVGRLGYLMFIKGEEYSRQASKNQTKNQIISPNRGTIYDCNGEVLAMSVPVDTISINPKNLKGVNNKEVDKELLAKEFSEVLELDYNETLDKINSDSQVVIIARKVEGESK